MKTNTAMLLQGTSTNVKNNELLALQASYQGKVPIEYIVKTGSGDWSQETREKMKSAAPGNDLMQYIILALKNQPDHQWASYALRDRLTNYFSHKGTLEAALGIKRQQDIRSNFRQETLSRKGITMKAEIVNRLKMRKKNEATFEEIATHLNKELKWTNKPAPNYTASTVRDIYYAHHKNPAVLKEIKDWQTSILKKIKAQENNA